MSATRETSIWCDLCVAWDRETGNAARARKHLRLKGWRRRRQGAKLVDVCPRCAGTHGPGSDRESYHDA